MKLWGEIGALWDLASNGQPDVAAQTATRLADASADAAELSILLGSRVLCEILLCRFEDSVQTAVQALAVAETATGELADDARYYTASVRLVAAAMYDPTLFGGHDAGDAGHDLPDLAAIQRYAAALDPARPERLLLLYPALEASMSSGDFESVARLVELAKPFRSSDSDFSLLIAPLVMTQFARSAAFRGELDSLSAQCDEILRLELRDVPDLVMLTEALLCYNAAQRSDRAEVERLSRRVLAVASGRMNYMAVGSCLLVTWSFSAIGQVQRAAALLIAAAGGPDLPRIKVWDQSFGYELLVTAALRRGDLAGALEWATMAEPLAAAPVATAAVERTLSRIADAMGSHEDAAARANASALLDAQSGAKLEGLRSRVLYASALAAGGHGELAIETLAQVAQEADRLGAASVRKLAAREWRTLSRQAPQVGGGFASLSDREREIAVLVAEGHTNRSIGSTLFLSERTVQTHLSRILGVLGLPSRTAIPAALGVGASDVDAPALTARQDEIARLIAQGMSNARIAGELGISVKTVENHLAGIFARWQVSSRTAVANLYVARSRRSA